MSKVQSIIFSKELWTKARSKTWLIKHGYKVRFANKSVHETQKYLRYRQKTPSKKARTRTIQFGKGIKAIIEF